jgi:two-component system sensor histidine kinase NblS
VGTTFWFDLPLEEADGDELRVQAERSASLAEIEAERRIPA